MRSRYYIVAVCLLVMSVLLTACGGKEKDKKVIHIQIAYENNTDEPLSKACEKWKELLEEKSNGEFQVDLYPSSQLGTKNDIINQAIAGDAVITLANGAFYSDLGVKDFGVVFAPYLFRSWDDIEKLAQSDWWEKQEQNVKNQTGLTIVGKNWHYGVRNTLTRKKVESPSDLKGKKIRVPSNLLQVDSINVLGAAATPMSLGDVYTSLQQGTIDGLENPITVIESGKYQEVAKYLLLDAHIYDLTTWCCGDEFYNSLSEKQKKILTETCEEAGVYNNEIVEEAEAKSLKELKKEGVKVQEVSDEEKDEWEKASESFYKNAEKKYGWTPDLIETVKSIIKE